MANRIEKELSAALETEPEEKSAAPKPPPGRLAAFLPLIVTLVVMPAVAWAMTTFVLVPKLQKSLGLAAARPADSHAGHDKSAPPPATGPDGKPITAKQTHTMTKLLVNVAGTMGSRYLLATVTIAGSAADFKTRVEKHEAQLRDSACTVLATKTITDLERPGARNLIRSELVTAFNNILGGSTIEEMYLTELAIQ